VKTDRRWCSGPGPSYEIGHPPKICGKVIGKAPSLQRPTVAGVAGSVVLRVYYEALCILTLRYEWRCKLPLYERVRSDALFQCFDVIVLYVRLL